jgi:beta-lactamase class A
MGMRKGRQHSNAMSVGFLAVALAIVAAAPLRAQSRSDTAALRRSIEQTINGYPGTVGVSVRNLTTGEQVSIRGSQTFPTLSLIKVAVLVTLMDEVDKGRVGLDERVAMIDRDKVGGTGVLQYLSSGTMPTMEDLAWLMITLSDNTAANLLLDKLDIRTVGLKMEALGLPHTKIFAKTFHRETSIAPDSSRLYGLGVTTPDEMVQLLTLLHQGKAVSPALDSLALRMLYANQDDRMMTRWLPGNVRVEHKTGTGDKSRTDCGIIYSPAAPLALCVLTTNNQDSSYAVDNAAHLIIARVARDVFHHFNPTVPLPPLPVVPPGGG